MAAGPYYATTTTANIWPYYATNTLPGSWYVQVLPRFEPPAPVDPRARDRLALLNARRSTVRDRTSGPVHGPGPYVRALAPRRTVVARGVVSWVRAGTRRPL